MRNYKTRIDRLYNLPQAAPEVDPAAVIAKLINALNAPEPIREAPAQVRKNAYVQNTINDIERDMIVKGG